jgi:hypothetical protein
MQKYLDMAPRNSLQDSHWKSICRRLLRPCPATASFVKREYQDGSEFNGILAFLTLKYSNLRDIVGIRPSKEGLGDAYSLTGDGQNVNWYTANEPNSWLEIDFKDRVVLLSSYVVRSRYSADHIPRNWVIECKNENTEYVVIDTRKNDGTLIGAEKHGNFVCPSQSDYPCFRYIGLRQTGKNSSNYDVLCFSKIELFGRLLEPLAF